MTKGLWPNGTPGRTYAIASDLSAVIPTEDGFGIYKTELEAISRLINMLEADRDVLADKLAKAKRRRRQLVQSRPMGDPVR